MILVWRKEQCLMWAALVCAALLAPVLAWAQAPCTHYASPNGGGNGLTAATPFLRCAPLLGRSAPWEDPVPA